MRTTKAHDCTDRPCQLGASALALPFITALSLLSWAFGFSRFILNVSLLRG